MGTCVTLPNYILVPLTGSHVITSLSSPGHRGDQGDEASVKKLVPAFLDVMDLLKNLPDATRSPALHKSHGNPEARPAVKSILKKTEKVLMSSSGPPPRARRPSISPGHTVSVVAVTQGPCPRVDSGYKSSCTKNHQDCPGCVSVPLQQPSGRVSDPQCEQEITTSC